MSNKIYWGRPGSYKTSSAVKNDLPEFALAGRVVVTNVRGLYNVERVKKVVEKQFSKKVPASFDIIHQECSTVEGRQKWATFFHWAPLGCAFIVDESQDVWRKKWTQKQIDELDYPGGADKAEKDGRPATFALAFDMHRHYNWDFVLTSPHIKKIRDDIREIADAAYKHVNMALVGISNKFKWFMHDPDNNCRSDGDIDNQKVGCVIPIWVFDLYESTATGDISDTRSGTAFWKNPKIITLAVLMVICWTYVGFNAGGLARFYKSDEPEIVSPGGAESGSPSPEKKAEESILKPVEFSTFTKPDIFYAGYVHTGGKKKYMFNIQSSEEQNGSLVTDKYFQVLGYAVVEISENMVLIANAKDAFYVKTKGVQSDKKLF